MEDLIYLIKREEYKIVKYCCFPFLSLVWKLPVQDNQLQRQLSDVLHTERERERVL